MQSQMSEVTDDELDRVLADQLLERWHYYTAAWRPKLGLPRIAPYCKDGKSSRQYEESSVLSLAQLHKREMEAVDWCVDEIDTASRIAIGNEMSKRKNNARRNREVNCMVWSCKKEVTYLEALKIVMPIMRGRGLFD